MIITVQQESEKTEYEIYDAIDEKLKTADRINIVFVWSEIFRSASFRYSPHVTCCLSDGYSPCPGVIQDSGAIAKFTYEATCVGRCSSWTN